MKGTHRTSGGNSGNSNKGIPTTPPTSQAARDFAAQPKSKAIKDPKVGYGGSSDKKRND